MRNKFKHKFNFNFKIYYNEKNYFRTVFNSRISGITLANEIKEDNNSSSKKEVSTKVNPKSIKGVCEYTTVTKYVDTCGSLQGRVSSWPTWLECPAGVQTRTRITTNVTVTVGPAKKCLTEATE
ncbi:hypothetical protein [Chryseobacterium indoltheticum]|uniref:hypothetical protein n=1 Tax=Chryseobacterium indoltheticum TaxID=254 RepID=UPI003F493FC1